MASEVLHHPNTFRRLVAEVFGTLALVAVAAGGDVVASTIGDVSPAARAVAPALLVMAMIYAIGNCSGAHFNPAVSFGFALRDAFPWEMVPAYWLAQIVGAPRRADSCGWSFRAPRTLAERSPTPESGRHWHSK